MHILTVYTVSNNSIKASKLWVINEIWKSECEKGMRNCMCACVLKTILYFSFADQSYHIRHLK